MAFEARFTVGQCVLALEGFTPRRYTWGIIKRVINVAREQGGPHYEVQFLCEDGDAYPETFFCIVPESNIFEDARALYRWRILECSQEASAGLRACKRRS